MLFIIAFDPLQKLFQLATEASVLRPIGHAAARFRISMYADDAALLLTPNREELAAVYEILWAFGQASGLITNLTKCTVYPIQCEGVNLQEIMQPFPCQIQSFLANILGSL